jgi:thiol-disulfide isomerase/thioredoxin
VIPEIAAPELKERIKQGGAPFAVYFFTPWCGTCKWGERMLDIVLTIETQVPLFKCNLNYAPDLAQEWKIQSVPCLTFIREGKVTEKLYRMGSVDILLASVRQWLL